MNTSTYKNILDGRGGLWVIQTRITKAVRLDGPEKNHSQNKVSKIKTSKEQDFYIDPLVNKEKQ